MPLRTCVGCRRKDDPGRSWARIAALPGGGLTVGRSAPGRGAWVCSEACFNQALRRGALARALRRDISGADAEALRARLDHTNF